MKKAPLLLATAGLLSFLVLLWLAFRTRDHWTLQSGVLVNEATGEARTRDGQEVFQPPKATQPLTPRDQWLNGMLPE